MSGRKSRGGRRFAALRGSPQEARVFEEEFGIVPTGKQYLAALETKIINGILDENRRSIAILRESVRQLNEQAETASRERLKEVHALLNKSATVLEELEQKFNRRIRVARACGYQPKVYRGARR